MHEASSCHVDFRLLSFPRTISEMSASSESARAALPSASTAPSATRASSAMTKTSVKNRSTAGPQLRRSRRSRADNRAQRRRSIAACRARARRSSASSAGSFSSASRRAASARRQFPRDVLDPLEQRRQLPEILRCRDLRQRLRACASRSSGLSHPGRRGSPRGRCGDRSRAARADSAPARRMNVCRRGIGPATGRQAGR